MKEETIHIAGRICHIVSDDREAQCVIVKPLGEFERLLLVNECERIKQLTDVPFIMFAFEVTEQDLREEGVEQTFNYMISEVIPEVKRHFPTLPYILGGYSLGGLFALWSATKTATFHAIASCSPSLWVDGWNEYAESHPVMAKAVYLSLGNKEANTKKGKFACVAERVSTQHQRHTDLLGAACCKLEINEGGHFTDIELRKAKGFAWCLEATVQNGR